MDAVNAWSPESPARRSSSVSVSSSTRARPSEVGASGSSRRLDGCSKFGAGYAAIVAELRRSTDGALEQDVAARSRRASSAVTGIPVFEPLHVARNDPLGAGASKVGRNGRLILEGARAYHALPISLPEDRIMRPRSSPRASSRRPSRTVLFCSPHCWPRAQGAYAAAPRALATQPDIHGDLIAFVHAEDIFTVQASGGVAKRLTFHEGEEKYPSSPPTGNGSRSRGLRRQHDVYVMNTEGGDITRVTYHPGGTRSSAGTRRTARSCSARTRRIQPLHRLYLIAPDGSDSRRCRCRRPAGAATQDGSQIAYTRVATRTGRGSATAAASHRTSTCTTSVAAPTAA